MDTILSLRDIRSLCGSTSYQRGEAYYRSHRVTELTHNPNQSRYDAVVRGSKRYKVWVILDEHSSDIEAECNCPAYDSSYYYCKHIAAVLFSIYGHLEGSKTSPLSQASKPAVIEAPVISNREMQATNNLISLFNSHSAPIHESEGSFAGNGQVLEVEFIVKVMTYGSYKPRLAMEIKVGPKRTYIVQKLKDFLSKVEKHAPYAFSKSFTFDPSEYAFKKDDGAIIEQLLDIYHNESIYREAYGFYSSGYGFNNERILIIPPSSWKQLHPLLSAATCRLEHGKQTFDRLELTREPVSLDFDLKQAASEGYQLNISGLTDMTVMDSYGCVAVDNKLHIMDLLNLGRVAGLKSMFSSTNGHQLRIAPSQMEPFMEQVIPGLTKIGSLRIAEQIANRIVRLPLTIKLFLDLEDDRLLAKLEYVYGDIIIDPMRGNLEHRDRGERILMRDADQENRFMRLFEQALFKYNGKELYMDQEEDIYQFLHRQLPQLEEWAKVLVTPALKPMTEKSLIQPKVSVDMNARTNLLDISFEMEGIDEQDIRSILRSLVEKKKYYRLPSGAFLSFEEEGFQEIDRLLAEMGVRKTEIKGTRLELPVVRGFHFMDAKEQTAAIKLGKSLRQLLENVRNPDNLDFQLPEKLSTVLRDYQKYGFQWMKTLGYYHFGGILADDMGLGKTLQSIAYILSEKQASRAVGYPVLIVSPASLTYNWKNEIAKFAPELHAVIAVGDRQERSGILDELTDVDVVITSYPLLRRDAELYAKQRFYALILDEAQAFKNHNTQTAQAVRAIDAGQRFALTGTPIENSLEELWSIYDAVFPELFASKKAFTELPREQIAKKIRPFLLRRMKTDVLKELPDKIETLQPSELSSEQKKLYLAYLAKLQEETIQQLQTEGLQKSRMKILAGITRLRQLCCHPSLFVDNYTGDSGKLDQLMEIIEECLGGGKRMLIFSQFTEMLGIIRSELGRRGLMAFYLDGKTPASDRVELCRRYNEGEQDIFLISLKAGGTGLNLTGADTVVLYDLWWNPAVEQQAADRAHRIGQKKVVQVIRLVTQGTIEEKMFELQQRKKDLINEVIQPGQEALSALTEQEIRELLMIG